MTAPMSANPPAEPRGEAEPIDGELQARELNELTDAQLEAITAGQVNATGFSLVNSALT